MLKIGDFSKLSRISIRMLRHYDEIDLLKPETVDDMTGYRYYQESQLPLAERIQVLKNLGFGLASIGEILGKYNNSAAMEQFLSVRRKELEEQAQLTKERLQLLDNTIRWLRKDGNLMNYEVTLKTLPQRDVASVRQVIPAYNAEGMLWQIMNEEIASQNVQHAVPAYGLAIFHDEGYKEADVDVEIQMSVSGKYKDTEHVVFKTVAPIQIASATYKGSYAQITKVNEAVAAWIQENGYEYDGPSFCIYHVSPYMAKTEDEMVTEVCYPVRKNKS